MTETAAPTHGEYLKAQSAARVETYQELVQQANEIGTAFTKAKQQVPEHLKRQTLDALEALQIAEAGHVVTRWRLELARHAEADGFIKADTRPGDPVVIPTGGLEGGA